MESIYGALHSVVKDAGMNEGVFGRVQRYILKKMEYIASAVAMCQAMRRDILCRWYAQVKVVGGKRMPSAMG